MGGMEETEKNHIRLIERFAYSYLLSRSLTASDGRNLILSI